MDGGVGLELDLCVDPGRLRVDDRDAGEHVPLVDPVAELGRGLRKLGARVDADEAARIGLGAVRGHAASGRDDVPDGVREVELALRVVRVELLERAPERGGVEDVVRGVQLLDRPLFGGRVPLLDDARDVSVRVADDAPVGKRHRRREGKKRHVRSVAAVRLDQLLEHLGGDERRVAGDDQDAAVETVERAARRRDRVARSDAASACTATSTESS